MKVYTSYWGNLRRLREAKIEPVAISRGKPKNWFGRSYDKLAPTWNMLKMESDQYDRCYEEILKRNDQDAFMHWLESGMKEGCDGVAILCWEKNPDECHRSKVAKWLKDAGYECEEFDKPKPKKDVVIQMALF